MLGALLIFDDLGRVDRLMTMFVARNCQTLFIVSFDQTMVQITTFEHSADMRNGTPTRAINHTLSDGRVVKEVVVGEDAELLLAGGVEV